MQGYELEVLKGCEPFLPRFEIVYVECSFLPLYAGQALASEVIGYLLARDYALIGVHNFTYWRTGEAVQANFLFCQGDSQKYASSIAAPRS